MFGAKSGKGLDLLHYYVHNHHRRVHAHQLSPSFLRHRFIIRPAAGAAAGEGAGEGAAAAAAAAPPPPPPSSSSPQTALPSMASTSSSSFAAQLSSANAGARGRRGSPDAQAKFVTILQRDGELLEFSRRLRCCQLLAAYPGNSVYLAAEFMREGDSKCLARESYLELGQVYFLLPQQQQPQASTAGGGAGAAASGGGGSARAAAAVSSSSSSLPPLVSQEFLGRLLGNRGSGEAATNCRPAAAAVLRHQQQQQQQQQQEAAAKSSSLLRSESWVSRKARNPAALRRARSGHWVASLSSIPEVAAV